MVKLTVTYATRPTQSYTIPASALPVALAAVEVYGTGSYKVEYL